MPNKTEKEGHKIAEWSNHRGGNRGLERVTVNLTSRSSSALQSAIELTGDTRTDTINRAIQIYSYLEQIIREGGSIHVRERAGARQERLKIIG